MSIRPYKTAGLATVLSGAALVGASLGMWLEGRRRGDFVMLADGLFVGVLGCATLALGNRLAVATLDHAERVRWTGDPGSDVGSFMSEPTEPELVADEVDQPVQSPRPMQHVSGGAML